MAASTSAGGVATAPRRPRRTPRRRLIALDAGSAETALVFSICAVFYIALGWRVVHDQHLVVFDATSRLAHAYFVLWNSPPKLAAIGFVWAPVSTFVFLPFAAIKPLATSLIALPVTSGVWAAAMMAVLARTGRFLGLPRWQRLSLVALFALNPMIVFYAINGMGEAPFLALLTIAVYFFIRWYVDDRPHHLVLCSVAITLGILCRYELIAFAVILGVAVPLILMQRRRRQAEVEGSTVAFLAPMVYGLGLWIFFNWLILGDPLVWLRSQISIGGGDTPVSAAFAQAGSQGKTPGVGQLLEQLVHVNAELFPLVLIVSPVLVLCWIFVRRSRQPMTLVLAVLVLANFLTTAILILKSPDANLLQLRYNMRSLPVALVAAMWLWWTMPRGWARHAVWGATLVVLAVTIPLTWQTMKTWPQQYEERVFVRAIETGKDQEGTDPGGPYTVGNAADREMSNWIKAHVRPIRDGILTDDAQTLGVVLQTGRPDLFLDRIDKGDEKWKKILNRPWGKVDYLLVARYPLPPAGIIDEIQKRYPGVRSRSLPGVSVEHANSHYVLLRVAPRRPTAPPSRFDKSVDDTENTKVPRL